MSVKWTWLVNLLASVLGGLLKLLSPEIRKLLGDALVGLYKKALATENPVDDMLVGFLLDVLGIPKPEE